MASINWGDLLFGFSGRINRGKFWLWILLYFVGAIVIGIVAALIGSAILTAILYLVFGIGALVSGIAVGLKRLHDRDRSGWWLLVFYVLPSVLSAVSIGFAFKGMLSGDLSGLATGGTGSMLLSLASFVIAIWGFVELGCLRGTVGPNQYGPDPLEARY
jgi:uncharacterized membrane protein YhaH (DUF805 family)